ncbi:hypothetical protein DFJ74DRAFT_682536 [Hyaloraphidium curvatum]|nr:hypothetical protein DFJ74DRAFT_682536 [Hyaloraphidium curvatum]
MGPRWPRGVRRGRQGPRRVLHGDDRERGSGGGQDGSLPDGVRGRRRRPLPGGGTRPPRAPPGPCSDPICHGRRLSGPCSGVPRRNGRDRGGRGPGRARDALPGPREEEAPLGPGPGASEEAGFGCEHDPGKRGTAAVSGRPCPALFLLRNRNHGSPVGDFDRQQLSPHDASR